MAKKLLVWIISSLNFVVNLIVLTIDVQTFAVLEQTGSQLIYWELFLFLYISCKRSMFTHRIYEGDEFFGCNLVIFNMPWKSPQRVHVAPLSMGIEVAKSLTSTQDLNFDLFDYRLVRRRAGLFSEIDSAIEVLRQILMYGHVKIWAGVPIWI